MTTLAKSTKEVLVAAKWMLENVGWTQRKFARNKMGNSCALDDYEQVACYCAAGAIFAVKSESEIFINQARIALRGAMDAGSLVTWNDEPGRTREQVLEAFQKAIDSCE